MNKRAFRRNVFWVIGVYAIALAVGIVLRLHDPSNKDAPAYATFKDLLPLIIAIPAAWLGYCFQRRQSYLKDVRDLWSKLAISVQDAIQYTHLTAPEQLDYAKVMKGLSVVTEEVRAVFANVGEAERRIGLFPFEGIKDIHDEVSRLGFGEVFTVERAREARQKIVAHWKELRWHYLTELERKAPARSHSPFFE
ncbi:hypothetical protein BurMR1_1868 [Burkholderia sp. MR1]|nr:hypothetical protein BurMR1_1868 [Burkholderia sp. MR1]